MESFFRTLKVEEVYMFEYDNCFLQSKSVPNFTRKLYHLKKINSDLPTIL
jgi:hypothetical protein